MYGIGWGGFSGTEKKRYFLKTGSTDVAFGEKPENRKKQTKIGISIKSVFKWHVRDYFAFESE